MTCDAKLLRALAIGRAPGIPFEQLYAKHRNAVYRYALVVSQSYSVAEDATQDTFVQMIERAGDYDSTRSDSAIGWLYGLLRNSVRKHLRERAVAPQLSEQPDLSVSTERIVELSSTVRELQSAMKILRVEYREVLYLVALEGLNYEATSKVLDIPVGTVRSRLSRARTELRAIMSDDDLLDTTEVANGQ